MRSGQDTTSHIRGSDLAQPVQSAGVHTAVSGTGLDLLPMELLAFTHFRNPSPTRVWYISSVLLTVWNLGSAFPRLVTSDWGIARRWPAGNGQLRFHRDHRCRVSASHESRGRIEPYRGHTRVTGAGVAEVQQVLPSCRIEE